MRKFLFFILTLVCAWCSGFVVADMINKPVTRDVPEFPETQKLSTEWHSASIPEQKIMLEFVSRDRLRELAGSEVPSGQSAAGLSFYTRDPCHVYLPADWTVSYRPGRGVAVFDDRENGYTLAHEIMHCVVGAWHPKWPVILSNRSTKQ